MNDGITESDLMALIEGDLPADRRAAVGEALRTDADLRRRVEGMIRDAQGLSQDRTDPPTAPSGAIARAMEASNAPLTVASARSPRRFAAAAIITLAMVGVWGGILYATFGPNVNARDRDALRPQFNVIIDEEQARVLERIINPPEIAQYGSDLGAPEPLEGLFASGQDAAPIDLSAEIELDPEIEQMLEDFAASTETEETLAEAAPRLGGLLADLEDSPTIEAVVAAAQDGRLRVLFGDLDPVAVLAESDFSGVGWLSHAMAMPTPGPHDFERDYAKPGPGGEDRAPAHAESAPIGVRLVVALTGASDEASRDRATAQALNRVLTEWLPALESPLVVHVRFVIEDAPIGGDDAGSPGVELGDLFPEDAAIMSVYFERDPAGE